MCLASSLIGVLIVIRKRSLLGEALSHASYLGVVGGVFLASVFFPFEEDQISFFILIGAFISALVALFLIDFLEKKSSDSKRCRPLFCFVSFFWMWHFTRKSHAIHADALVSTDSVISLWASGHDTRSPSLALFFSRPFYWDHAFFVLSHDSSDAF
jgi:ABC-type Mn2+/Zn2+ transport system permease subunit